MLCVLLCSAPPRSTALQPLQAARRYAAVPRYPLPPYPANTMHIAFDAKRLFCNDTGLGNYSRTLLRTLATHYPTEEYVLYTPGIRLKAAAAPFLDLSCARTVLPRGVVRGSLWRSRVMGRLARQAGCDVFHGLSHELPHGLGGEALPAAVTMHDVAWRTFPDMYKPWDRAIYDLKARHACREAAAVVCISQATAHDVARFYHVAPERLHVVYQPVRELFYTPLAEAEAATRRKRLDGVPHEYLLYVGTVNSRKNLLGAVKALELLPESVRLPLVVVGGGGAYKARVQAYVASHGLEALVRFLPHVADARDLQALYGGATVFVYPSFYEGFGLPVVEAALCGTPVVTSCVSSLPEAAGPHAELADPADAGSLRDALLRLLDDTTRRRDMGQKARRWAADTFSSERFATQMMSIYRDIAARR